ncbi:GPP34 family phosphoprotein [Streptomyces sp. NPDC046909]|uniref:GOLPH3/VPS74 family protein n=1 Tax=Streptomyces sp. NPDC046909 TaxID=3155617 RepID=UPI0033DF7716
MPNGPLSLPARLFLLAWDPGGNELTSTTHAQHLVRAGALAELARRGLLVDDDGIATPADMDSHTGDSVLDGLLELVRESRPHHWRSWVPLHARVTLEAVREQLAAEGYLRAEKRRVLGVFPTVEYTLDRPAVVAALREEVRQVLEGPANPAEISDRDAAVAVLAAAADLRTLGPRGERSRHKERLEALVERSATATPPLRTVVPELCAALSTVVAPTGG